MRLINFLNELNNTPLDNFTDIAMLCTKTARLNVDLYRGMERIPSKFKYGKTDTSSLNRSPLTSGIEWHNFLNEGFYTVFGERLRSNTTFCTGNRLDAEIYGNLYKIYPSDDFSVFWSNEIKDLFLFFNKASDLLTVESNDEKAFASVWALLHTNNSAFEDIKYNLLRLNCIEWILSNFGNLLLYLERRTVTPLKAAKSILEKFPMCSSKFIRKYYTKGTTVQDLKNAIQSKNEIMLKCSYYCWEKI